MKIKVVADEKANSEKYTAVTFLLNQGIDARLNNRYAIMHHKFMVIDDKTTETGSFNYSSSANKRNAENVIVIWNNPNVAKSYSQEFDRLWKESEAKKPHLAPSHRKTKLSLSSCSNF